MHLPIAAYAELSQGLDKSYRRSIVPLFEDALRAKRYDNILDAGCGLGFLTKAVAQYAERATGIDVSKRSIEMASAHNARDNLTYFCTSVEEFISKDRFDCIISCMVLMDCPDLSAYVASCSSKLAVGGALHAIFINPMFWPRYWGYEKLKWFSYNKEIFIEGNFKTSSLGKSGFVSTHVHRPLSMQIDEMTKAGLSINRLSR